MFDLLNHFSRESMGKPRQVCMFHGSDTIITGAFSASGSVAATGGKGKILTQVMKPKSE